MSKEKQVNGEGQRRGGRGWEEKGEKRDGEEGMEWAEKGKEEENKEEDKMKERRNWGKGKRERGRQGNQLAYL